MPHDKILPLLLEIPALVAVVCSTRFYLREVKRSVEAHNKPEEA